MPQGLSRQRLCSVRMVAVALALAACESTSHTGRRLRNTFACLLAGERLVVRFEAGEARLLLPTGDRVALYQIPAASGVRFSNGTLELRGKGTDLQLIRDGNPMPLADCQPYAAPK
jgi:membrane-bound inhibitor of C-type lysozyme